MKPNLTSGANGRKHINDIFLSSTPSASLSLQNRNKLMMQNRHCLMLPAAISRGRLHTGREKGRVWIENVQMNLTICRTFADIFFCFRDTKNILIHQTVNDTEVSPCMNDDDCLYCKMSLPPLLHSILNFLAHICSKIILYF